MMVASTWSTLSYWSGTAWISRRSFPPEAGFPRQKAIVVGTPSTWAGRRKGSLTLQAYGQVGGHHRALRCLYAAVPW